MKKADFIKAVAQQSGVTQKEADAVVTAALDIISRPARHSRNWSTRRSL